MQEKNSLLRNERRRRGWTQLQLATRAGVSVSTVERAERGYPLRMDNIHLLCSCLGKDADQLGLFKAEDNEQDREQSPDNTPRKAIKNNNVLQRDRMSLDRTNNVDNTQKSTLIELLQPLTENRECAWTYAWGLGEEVSNIQLVYDNASAYESTMPDDVQQALDDWCRQNPSKCNEITKEPPGTQVRLKKAEWSHRTYKYLVSLAPSRYMNYVAIHPQLGKTQLRSLRDTYFDNALNGIRNGESLVLPSNFALHMAVVSQDGYLLLRRRASNTELYPSAWEAGVGEFMHGPADVLSPEYESGPYHSQFPHFTEEGHPDLFMFLKNTVAEELGYPDARQENFLLYGFAVEYETLAPKLLVVYNADCTIKTLLESARKASDRARELSRLELQPHTIAEAISSSRYPSWGPTSKLVMLLALKQDLASRGIEEQAFEITELVDSFEPQKVFSDPWQFHE